MARNKTGGGVGTNQYQTKGKARSAPKIASPQPTPALAQDPFELMVGQHGDQWPQQAQQLADHPDVMVAYSLSQVSDLPIDVQHQLAHRATSTQDSGLAVSLLCRLDLDLDSLNELVEHEDEQVVALVWENKKVPKLWHTIRILGGP